MNRYLKDPIILLCSISWVIALLVFLYQVGEKVSKPTVAQSAPPAAQVASTTQAPALSGATATGMTNLAGSTTPQIANGAASNPAVVQAAVPATLPNGVVLNGIIRHIAGQITVGKSAQADTIDLEAAFKQRKPDEKIFIEAGIYSLDEYPTATTPEHIAVKGVGASSVIKLHSQGIGVIGNSRFEDLTIEGPAGTSSFWVQNSGILTLKNINLRESSFGVSVSNSGKLYADNLKEDKIDSYCIALSNSATAEISGSNFTDCFAAINVSNMAKADIHSSNFHSNTFAFDVKDDRNHATCSSCGFESVANKVNIESRLTLTERTLEKPAAPKTSDLAPASDITTFKGETANTKAVN